MSRPTHHAVVLVGVCALFCAAQLVRGEDSLEWEHVLHNPGNVLTPPSAYGNCSRWDSLGSNWVLRVEMGRIVDYFRPNGNVTLCTVLKATSRPTKKFMWGTSPVGDFTIPAMYHTHMGGSEKNWPSDGRVYMSFWGSQQAFYGGCCHYVNDQTRGSDAQDDAAWNRAFTVSVAASVNRRGSDDGDSGTAVWVSVVLVVGVVALVALAVYMNKVNKRRLESLRQSDAGPGKGAPQA